MTIAQRRQSGARLTNALSVDVEDYFQVSAFAGTVPRAAWDGYPARVADNTRRILDMFAEADAKATFFVLGWVARRHPDLIRAITDAGHELASHGAADLDKVGGVPVVGYRAASFSINRATWWAFDELALAGYRYSSSVNPIRHDHYGVHDAPRFPFVPREGGPVEIPMTTVTVLGRRLPCSGGGFFRLLPYEWFRRGIGRVNRVEGMPAIFYFHPWEIDPDQPRIAGLPWRSRFRHYVNLDVTANKLRRLLGDFRWSRIDVAFAEALSTGR